METLSRKPFQGIYNIIRFNWHYYAILLIVCIIIVIAKILFLHDSIYCNVLLWSILIPMLISLVVSYYIYDLSNLYTFDWVKPQHQKSSDDSHIIHIHAGFDETSYILHQKYPKANLTILDFYNPAKHTEISIKRARKAYPAYPNTKTTDTTKIELPNAYADMIFLMLAAHEIRDHKERIAFFSELKRVLKPHGHIIVTEHLRDVPNIVVYNIGALHFFTKSTWLNTFQQAGLRVDTQYHINPFITTFILSHHGIAP